MQSAASLVGAETDLVRVKGEIQNIIAAVKQGLLHASMREALTELEERNSTLEKEIAATPLRPPPLHTNRPSANAEMAADRHSSEIGPKAGVRKPEPCHSL